MKISDLSGIKIKLKNLVTKFQQRPFKQNMKIREVSP